MTGVDNRDPYAILQVAHNATSDTINSAYRKLVRLYHPDVNRSPDATAKMQDINWARDLLTDSTKRRQYDLQRAMRQARRAQPARPTGPQPPPYTRYYEPPVRPAGWAQRPHPKPKPRPTGGTQQRAQQERSQQRTTPGADWRRSAEPGTDWRRGDTGAYGRREDTGTGWRRGDAPPPGEQWARPRETASAWQTGWDHPSAGSRRASRPARERGNASGAATREQPARARPAPREPDWFAAAETAVRTAWAWVLAGTRAPASALSLGVATVGVVLFVLVFALRGSSGSGSEITALYEVPHATPTNVFVFQGARTLEGQWIDIWGEAYREGIQQLVDNTGWQIQVRLGDRVFVNAITPSDAYYCRTLSLGGADPTPVPPGTLEGCIPITLPAYLGGQDAG